MTATVQDLLKKINYIEADLEIHKQILFSIPSAESAAIEKTIHLIAGKRAEIEDLREQIKAVDPEEYRRILNLEKVVSEFKNLATTKGFTSIIGKNVDEPCTLRLKEGSLIDCLVKACDSAGSWTVITLDGQLRHFTLEMVDEQPPTQPMQQSPV